MKSLPVADCQDCGACCMHMGYPAFNLTVEQSSNHEQVIERDLPIAASADLRRWSAMPSALRDQILLQMRQYRPPAESALDGPCIWLDLDSRECRHHQHRPQVCRDFPVGGPGCLEWRDALLNDDPEQNRL